MVISFNSSGEMVVTKTFTNPAYNYRMVDYTGGIPPGEDLSLPGGQSAAQGIIVHYSVTPGNGNQTVEWTLSQYADGSSSPLRFGVKVFLVKSGGTTSEEDKGQDQTKYK